MNTPILICHSHSTMYLLKRTRLEVEIMIEEDSHSTMYLLKLSDQRNVSETILDSHSTMYLLKPATSAAG